MNELGLYLDGLDDATARAVLHRCCAARRWVEGMLAARPFGAAEAVLTAADAVWSRMLPDDWREAMAAHPRLGARVEGDDPSAVWSRGEQAGVAHGEHAVRAALASGNRAYERRFGHVFLLCATGKGPEEMLAELEHRLVHDPKTELRVAAAEQAKITRLRLAKLAREGA